MSGTFSCFSEVVPSVIINCNQKRARSHSVRIISIVINLVKCVFILFLTFHWKQQGWIADFPPPMLTYEHGSLCVLLTVEIVYLVILDFNFVLFFTSLPEFHHCTTSQRCSESVIIVIEVVEVSRLMLVWVIHMSQYAQVKQGCGKEVTALLLLFMNGLWDTKIVLPGTSQCATSYQNVFCERLQVMVLA